MVGLAKSPAVKKGAWGCRDNKAGSQLHPVKLREGQWQLMGLEAAFPKVCSKER